MIVDPRGAAYIDSNMKSSASLMSHRSSSMEESMGDLRSIRELDEEHFGAIDGRLNKRKSLNTSILENAS